ncbi:sporulation initiation factor Spo0A C-terminal domain-containing protein [Bengtsoniella intestinalis]|uniref:sporulation initiation factor Spo0A C-terminal domain-containing protein n=1 Tax=Bengtsoniella intestinalis TaxID=3073143 RepID=UPI00391F4A35
MMHDVPFIYPRIYDTLYELGITANYVGFFHTSFGVYLAVNQPERMQYITKWLYPDIAKQYHTNWKSVERNIRSVTAIAWNTNPLLLQTMARHPLSKRPCNSQFIAILAAQFPLPLFGACALLPQEGLTVSNKEYRHLVAVASEADRQKISI